MISPDQTETMTLTVKAISGPLMFLMLVVNVFAVAALWQILKAANRAAVALWQIVEGISRIEQTYDEQVNGPGGGEDDTDQPIATVQSPSNIGALGIDEE
jgi:hypothetical protein